MRISWIYGLLLLLCSCSREETLHYSYDRYIQWIRNPKNELNQIKKVQNLIFSLQYMPPEYFTKPQHGVLYGASLDTFNYDNQITLSLMVDIDKENSVSIDPFFINAHSLDEVEERKKMFEETIEQNSYIVSNNQHHNPVLCVEDISNGLVNTKTVILTFDKPKDFTSYGFEFIWNDMVFRTGIHKFNFTPTILSHIPTLDKGQQ